MTTRSTAAAAFRYDATSGQYVFNWSTKGLTAGTYQLRIDLADGGEQDGASLGPTFPSKSLSRRTTRLCVISGFFSTFGSNFAVAQTAHFSPSLGFETQDSTGFR